uniref:Glucose-methanol-choline oxidoreductase N-terminal domain-containing protein n=1 Tax=Clastoptera arizonana TaxID=38151 RepID=A0A1B6D0X9_9HEMI
MYITLILLVYCCIKWSNCYESCSVNSTDAGSSLVQQLYQKIGQGECSLMSNTKYKQYEVKDGEEFDYIVVGSGSAGSVVASRLSEKFNVLLLEAGGDPTLTSEIPALIVRTFHSEIDWDYEAEFNESYCLSYVNKRCYWPRGKAIGGSSAINGMMYVRGYAQDYNTWAENGNTEWSYKEVLPFFKMSEDFQAQEVSNIKTKKFYHGFDGPLKINTLPSPPHEKILSSIFADRGMKTYNDVNINNKNEGFFIVQGTVSNGQRLSSARAYLKPIQNRPTIKISKFSQVTKVLIKNNTAYGVEFLKNGVYFKVKAKTEVILSAGAIDSPKILMLSGIGPKEHLKEMGIDVVQNLPVGKNLRDHMITNGIFYLINATFPGPSMIDASYTYLTNFTGPLSGIGALTNVAFIKANSSYPNIELLFSVINKNDSASLIANFRALRINEEVINSAVDLLKKGTLLQILPILLKPKSVGKILLNSANPLDKPKIYPGYLSNPEDIRTFLKSIHFITNLCSTKTMKSLNGKLKILKIQACESYKFNTDDYWICILMNLGRTVYHPVGTCKMGPKNDLDAVVDPQLRVRGIKNLRVIDASIFPSHISGHTNAAAIMIGERGAFFIKKALSNQSD